MNQNDDPTLDEYLDGKSSLSKIYRHGSKSQPPADLDIKILAQARQAVGEPPASDRNRGIMARRPRWLVPVSLAATLMLGINLAYHLKDYSTDITYSEDSAVVMSPRFEAKRQQAVEQKTQMKSEPDGPERTSGRSRPIDLTRRVSPEMESQLANAPAPGTAALLETDELPATNEAPDQIADAMPAPKRKTSAVTNEPAHALSRSSGVSVESRNDYEFYEMARTNTPVYRCDLSAYGLSDLEIKNQVRESRLNQTAPAAWKNTIVGHAKRGEYRQACLEFAAFVQHYPNAMLPDDFPVRLSD